MLFCYIHMVLFFGVQVLGFGHKPQLCHFTLYLWPQQLSSVILNLIMCPCWPQTHCAAKNELLMLLLPSCKHRDWHDYHTSLDFDYCAFGVRWRERALSGEHRVQSRGMFLCSSRALSHRLILCHLTKSMCSPTWGTGLESCYFCLCRVVIQVKSLFISPAPRFWN